MIAMEGFLFIFINKEEGATKKELSLLLYGPIFSHCDISMSGDCISINYKT